jgi:hypothetical protein
MSSVFSRSKWLCLLAAGLLALAGCEKEEIQTYTVPQPAPETYQARVRLLGAILENGQEQWFFKLAGPLDEVAKHKGEFNAFVESVRFTGKAESPVEWKAPAGWELEKSPAGGLRYATFHLGPKSKAPELSVFKFDRVSSVLSNVQRWCKTDLGRKPLRGERELAEVTRKFSAGDKEGVLVDMTGPGVAGKGRSPHGMGGMRRPQALPITYQVPEAWQGKETGPVLKEGGIRLFTTFQLLDGRDAAAVEVSHMAVGGGELLNVNRWRRQVDLPPITQAQLESSPPRTIRVDGANAPFYDFAGPGRRSLVVAVKRGEMTWYFKLLGSANLVEQNKSRFESFVQSVKFTGGADE